jgi:hypothetical protein
VQAAALAGLVDEPEDAPDPPYARRQDEHDGEREQEAPDDLRVVAKSVQDALLRAVQAVSGIAQPGNDVSGWARKLSSIARYFVP